MKVAIISKYNGVVERGVENWAIEIKKRLGKNVDIISGNYIFQLRKILKYDILVPVNGRFQTIFIRFFTLVTGKKMIIFGHSGPGADDKWNLICSPNIFVAFTDTQKKWAEKFKMPWTKVIKISHSIDTEKFTPSEKSIVNTVICVAADIPQKRVQLVRKAVRNLDKVKLLVAGSGQENVVSYKKMPDFYKRGTVFAFTPEPWEAFGLVYLEAMATNLPIVTIDDSVRREIVGRAGILVKNPEDVEQLSKAIKTALNTKWANKPRMQAEKFSWDKNLPEYKKLFSL